MYLLQVISLQHSQFVWIKSSLTKIYDLKYLEDQPARGYFRAPKRRFTAALYKLRSITCTRFASGLTPVGY